MSLVGSLQDLGLADILQIVSLARKSGLLLLRSDHGEGRIVFRDGLIQAAFVKGEPEDLRGLLVGGAFLDAATFEAAAAATQRRGIALCESLLEHSDLTRERLDSLCRERVERAVLKMFRWRVGEFSFEVRGEIEARDEELMLATGVNAQYLTMEATRLGDETPDGAPPPADAADSEEAPVFSGEPAAHEALAFASARSVPDADAAPGLVAIDPDLPALEWLKSAVDGLFARVHIFQQTETGIARIRQYLARAEPPVVLISADAPADPLTGVSDLADFIRRLRSQAPRIPILVMREQGREPPRCADAADAVVSRPATAELADPGLWPRQRAAVASLRENLRPWAAPRDPAPPASQGPSSLPTLERLRQLSRHLQDPARRGEVLSLALAFAAEHFPRVAMFMVRDHEALGIAQVRLDSAGGPDDAAIRDVRVPIADSDWLRGAVEGRGALRAAPGGEGDRRLAGRLGSALPAEAYVAPILGGDRVVALLYADTLPAGGPIGDTAAVEIVLHEAGLALDRALLERTLEASRERGDPAA